MRAQARLMSRLTICQTSIIRLDVIVDLKHLTPASGSCYSEHVADILWPSISMNCCGHILGVYQIKIVGRKGEPKSCQQC